MEKRGAARQATDDMRFARWINKTTDARTEYVILIPFPRQQWFHERASVLHCSTYIACLVLVLLQVQAYATGRSFMQGSSTDSVISSDHMQQ